MSPPITSSYTCKDGHAHVSHVNVFTCACTYKHMYEQDHVCTNTCIMHAQTHASYMHKHTHRACTYTYNCECRLESHLASLHKLASHASRILNRRLKDQDLIGIKVIRDYEHSLHVKAHGVFELRYVA